MNRRPVGVTILAALYFLSGLMGLLLTVYGLFSTLLWSAGGVVLVSSSLALGWGLWQLQSWAHRLAMVFHVCAVLGQIGLSVGAITTFDAPALAVPAFAGAAASALAIWYLARPRVRRAFQRPSGDTTVLDKLPERRLSALSLATPTPNLDGPPASLLGALRQGGAALPVTAWLVVRSGAQVGQQFLLNRERNTIGRDAVRASIKVEDPLVSRQHAQFNFERDQVLLYDLASTNGTFVNNRRVQKYVLNDGDVVRVGETEFVFKQMT